VLDVSRNGGTFVPCLNEVDFILVFDFEGYEIELLKLLTDAAQRMGIGQLGGQLARKIEDLHIGQNT
jgi:hypothetical protein